MVSNILQQQHNYATYTDRTLVGLHFCTQEPLWILCCRQNHPTSDKEHVVNTLKSLKVLKLP